MPKSNILIVEDNIINQKVLAAMLGGFDLKLIFTGSGEEAIQVFKAENIDLILMDVQLPAMSGVETAVEIRQLENKLNKKKCIILALTAEVFKINEDNCLKAGMDSFLTKPIKLQTLMNELSRFGISLKSRIENQ